MGVELLIPVVIVLNVLFFGLVFVGGVLWIRKLMRDLRAPDDVPRLGRVLDELEVVQIQIRALGERLERIEGSLSAGPDSHGLLGKAGEEGEP